MSCQKIDDLEDLAANIFDFDEDEPRQPRRQRALKKQRKPKTNNKSTLEQTQQQQNIEEHIPVEKPLGSHSIYVKTFGCSHNISDSQLMIGLLTEYGYKMVESVGEADLVLINSCTVVNPSQDAFISMVCRAKKIKKPLVVAGCVPQGDQNIPQLAQISAVGVTQIDRIVEVVEQTLKGHKVQLLQKKDLPSLDLPKIRKNKDIQIITINAGCLGACTYCKTVFARGKLLSYTPESITNRVSSVIKAGVKQIWLTSEDTGAYGRDINTNISQLLVSLCQQLKSHTKIMMRIGMTNPPYMLDQLSSIAHFLNHPRVFSFIHIPIQAGHNNVLEKMNRQYTVQQFRQVVDYFIEHVPDVTIATDIICGFAEQTDQQFEASLKLIEQYKFRVVNINQFYLRPGTSAANLKPVPSKIVKSRSSKLTQLFRSYDKQRHKYMLNRQQRVWINEFQFYKGQKFLVGHTKNYTKVIIPYNQELSYKQVIMKITKTFQWHIEGEIIDYHPMDIEIDPSYVENMRKDIIDERERIKNRKEVKINKYKEKKIQIQQEIQNKQIILTKKEQCGCSKGTCGCTNSTCECKTKPAMQIQEKNIAPSEPSIIITEHTVNEKTTEQLQIQKPNKLYLILSIVFLVLGFGLLILE